MPHLPEQEYGNMIERELADRKPFGSSQHINNLIDRLYLGRLSLSQSIVPAAAEVMEGLRSLTADQQHFFLRDSALRLGVDQAFMHAKALPARHTLERTERLLQRAALLLKCRSKTALLETGQPASAKLGRGLFSPRVWQDCNSDPSSHCIPELVREIVPDAHIDRPSEERVGTLLAAVTLLERLLYRLTWSVLNHAVIVVIVSRRGTPGSGYRGFRSGTTSSLPGVMVLSASELATPWRAAEALLHESLHLKFIDLEFTHSMGVKDHATDAQWGIRPPWCELSAGEGWPPVRAMTAAHVYMGLELLFERSQRAAKRSDPTLGYPSSAELQAASRRAAYRARFLISALEEHLQSLGLAGQHFVTWLKELQSRRDDAQNDVRPNA